MMTTPPPGMDDPNDELLIASIQSILLSQERGRLQQIEQQIEATRVGAQSEREALREQVRDLLRDVETLRQTARASEERARDLQVQVELLRRKAQADSEGLVARLTPVFGDLMRPPNPRQPGRDGRGARPDHGRSDPGADPRISPGYGRGALSRRRRDGAKVRHRVHSRASAQH